MKKLVLVLFALALVVSGAFANGQNEGAAQTKAVKVNTMAYGDNSNQEGITWKRIVDTFEKNNPKIDIAFELLYDEAYHQKVVSRLAAGDIPDLAYMGADARWGKPWVEAKQQWDHRELLKKVDMFDMKLIPAMGPNGEIYEIPLGTSNITTVLYANKNLITKLGGKIPTTYEDIVALVPAAQKAGLEVVSIDGADGWAWGSCLMSCIIARMSGDAHWVSKAVAGSKKFTDPEFVNALKMLKKMVADGVISPKSVLVDYGTNTSNYNNGKALFMIQGQWAAGNIENPEVANNTAMLAWPKFPGEKAGAEGSVAAAIQVGYGLTKKGASDPAVQAAALKFLQVYYSEPETTQRLRDGGIVAPILKNYKVPADLPQIIKEKVALAQKAMNTDVIDAFLSGAPNDTLNAGMQKIVSGTTTPEDLAAEVEKLLRK